MAKTLWHMPRKIAIFDRGCCSLCFGPNFRALEGSLSLVRPSSFWGLSEWPGSDDAADSVPVKKPMCRIFDRHAITLVTVGIYIRNRQRSEYSIVTP